MENGELKPSSGYVYVVFKHFADYYLFYGIFLLVYGDTGDVFFFVLFGFYG